jgi:transcriptional regulator with XRE-family HTH domain
MPLRSRVPDWSQERLAEDSGVSIPTVRRLEKKVGYFIWAALFGRHQGQSFFAGACQPSIELLRILCICNDIGRKPRGLRYVGRNKGSEKSGPLFFLVEATVFNPQPESVACGDAAINKSVRFQQPQVGAIGRLVAALGHWI